MNYLFIGLTAAAIISQVPHAWFVFDSFSNINHKWLKNLQSMMFCSILSISILAFALDGQRWMALLGAAIEAIINIYYYTLNFWKEGITARTPETRKKSILKFWRMNWIKIFFAILLPSLIFIFAEQL